MAARIIDLIDQRKINDMRFCTFWFEPTAQGKLMLNLAFGQSKYYSDSLSVNIRRGQRQKTLQGEWGWKAPVGYLNHPELRSVVIDPAKAPLVKRAFELYATGKYTLDGIRDHMNGAGLRSVRGNSMPASVYQHFLKNPFYYGLFQLNGELHQGVHEPLITKVLYDQVQEVMRRRSKPSAVVSRLKAYAYRGLLRCANCGCVVTMETQKGHNYLRCTKRVVKDCAQPYAREECVTDQIAEALTSVSLPDHWAAWMIQELARDRTHADREGEDMRNAITAQTTAIDKKLDRLTAAYLDAGAFSAIEFRTRKAELLNLKRKLLDDLTVVAKSTESRFEPIIRFVNDSKQRKYVAQRRDLTELRTIFEQTGSNLVLANRRVGWEPRGAWKLVVDQGPFALPDAAPATDAARRAGESDMIETKWSRPGSNRQPLACKASALPIELRPRVLNDLMTPLATSPGWKPGAISPRGA